MKKTKNLNVLIAGNNLLYSACISSLLNKYKVKHKITLNKKESIDEYIISCEKNKNINLIITSLNIPNSSGYDISEKIREYESEKKLKKAKIYAIIPEEYNNKNKDNLFDEYLDKEYAILSLSRIIEKYKILGTEKEEVIEKENQKRKYWIIEELEKQQKIKSKDIMDKFNIHRDTAWRDLKELINDNKIIKKGCKSKSYYELKR
jgi:CheY-like chemotaxis protein